MGISSSLDNFQEITSDLVYHIDQRNWTILYPQAEQGWSHWPHVWYHANTQELLYGNQSSAYWCQNLCSVLIVSNTFYDTNLEAVHDWDSKAPY